MDGKIDLASKNVWCDQTWENYKVQNLTSSKIPKKVYGYV